MELWIVGPQGEGREEERGGKGTEDGWITEWFASGWLRWLVGFSLCVKYIR